MKKAWGANEVGRCFVTGATDAAGKPSHFYCRICHKDVSVLMHGPHEVMRHFHAVKAFACDQRLRLGTPGWRVLDFEGNPVSGSELERQRERILGGPLVIRDRGIFLLGIWLWTILEPRMPRYQSLPRCRRWLKCCDWAAPTSWLANCGRNARWLPGEWTLTWHGLGRRCWLVFSCSMCPGMYLHWLFVVVFKSIILNGTYPRIIYSCDRLGEGAWTVQHRVSGARLRGLGDGADVGDVHISPCLCCGVEPIQRQYYPRGYDSGKISGCCWSRCICCVSAWRSTCSGRSLGKLFGKWVRYLRLIKRCLQRTAASVFGNLDPFSMTEFVVDRLKRAEPRDWMASCPALRKAIITNDLSMPDLLDDVANFAGVWPLVLSYLNETGRNDDGHSLMVRFSTLGVFYLCHVDVFITALLFGRKGWTSICTTLSLLAWNSSCFIFFWKPVSIIITFQYDTRWYVVVPDQFLENF